MNNFVMLNQIYCHTELDVYPVMLNEIFCHTRLYLCHITLAHLTKYVVTLYQIYAYHAGQNILSCWINYFMTLDKICCHAGPNVCPVTLDKICCHAGSNVCPVTLNQISCHAGPNVCSVTLN
jgi:hypothetical protein